MGRRGGGGGWGVGRWGKSGNKVSLVAGIVLHTSSRCALALLATALTTVALPTLPGPAAVTSQPHTISYVY